MTTAPLRLAALALASLAALPVVAPLACPIPKGAVLSADDTERMLGFDSSRTRGLAEALLSDSVDERAVVAELFTTASEPVEVMPDGDYRCRTIKMGGLLPLTVYGYFDCAVADNGTRIEKTSGSQRFTGELRGTRDGLFYQGAQHYNDDPPRRYGDDDEFDQVGCLYRVGAENRYRLELPTPQFESTHDVIELVPER